jgi:hypothetical protein
MRVGIARLNHANVSRGQTWDSLVLRDSPSWGRTELPRMAHGHNGWLAIAIPWYTDTRSLQVEDLFVNRVWSRAPEPKSSRLRT